MIIKLKKFEYDVLINSKFISEETKRIVNEACKESKGIYLITLNRDIVDEINENLVEQFQYSGIGIDGEPNSEGLVIEGLIDKFFYRLKEHFGPAAQGYEMHTSHGHPNAKRYAADELSDERDAHRIFVATESGIILSTHKLAESVLRMDSNGHHVELSFPTQDSHDV